MWWIQTFGWGKFDILPSISHLFLRWRGAKVYSQTGWGDMAGFSPLDLPLVLSCHFQYYYKYLIHTTNSPDPPIFSPNIQWSWGPLKTQNGQITLLHLRCPSVCPPRSWTSAYRFCRLALRPICSNAQWRRVCAVCPQVRVSSEAVAVCGTSLAVIALSYAFLNFGRRILNQNTVVLMHLLGLHACRP